MSFKLKSFFVIVIGNLLIILFILRKSDLIWIPTFLEHTPKITSYYSISETNLSFHEKFMNERIWSKYLLEIDALLSKIEAGQAQIPTDMERTTDGLHTELSVTNASSFEVGDVVEGFIQAKDHYGRNKKHGGDYFRARLIRLKNGFLSYDGVPIVVNDDGNGRYHFYTQIPWPGKSKLVIELMQPSEAVLELINKTAPFYDGGVYFRGKFPSGTKTVCDVMLRNCIKSFIKIFETSVEYICCGLISADDTGSGEAVRFRYKSNDTCDFSEPENGISFFCVRPEKETCPKQLTFTETIEDKNKPFIISGPFYKLGVTYQVEIKGSSFTLEAATTKGKKHKELPDCNLNSIKTSTDSVKGYFDGKVWQSFLCNNKIKTLDAAEHCLRNKTIYFIGDSTSRQLHIELASFLKIPDKLFGKTQFWTNPRKAEDRSRNLVIEYKAHGLPMRNPGPRASHPPVVETLNEITNDNRDVIVVFNIGPHYVLHHPSVFIQRVTHIKRAIEALRKRIPNVKVFVKGSVRNKSIYRKQPSEWLLYRFDRIVRQILSDVMYIDTWSMSTVQPQKSVHADSWMLRQFLAFLFSHVCV